MSAPTLYRASRLAIALVALVAGPAAGQPAVYESEPNETPAEATRISGPAVLIGSMAAGDQDGFLWTVSDVQAQKRWTFELKGIPGELTVVDVLRLEYADNGVDVTGRKKLLTIGSRDGTKPGVAADLLLEPGEYLLGIARSGRGAGYRPPLDRAGFQGSEPAGGTPAPSKDQPAGGYRLTIREGSRLLLDANPQPHDVSGRAQRLRPDSEHAAFTEEGTAWFALALGAKAAADTWEIAGQVPVGRTATAFLRDAGGKELARAGTDARGRFAFRDLGAGAGRYLLEVQERAGGMILAVRARSTGQRAEGAEAEPNDTWSRANRTALSGPLSGRMGRRGESDYFSFVVDEASADRLLTLRLETGAGASLQLCLLDGDGQPLQCRERKGGIALPDLLLAPGEYGVLVARGPEAATYTVHLEAGLEPRPGVEIEPNDTVALASSVPANLRVKGRFAGAGDADFYRFVVTGEPQLWRFQVIGTGIHEVAYHDGAGIQGQRVRAPKGRRRVRLENVFLLPGEHSVSVSSRGDGEYTLLALPLGPPDPNGEREPNDDTSRMQLMRVGQTRTGLLQDPADQDNYRFFLPGWDRVRLAVTPPSDGAIQAQLYWDTSPFRASAPARPGEPLVLEGLFPPGDYRLALSAATPSEAEYRLALERLDRFACPADCEPNDDPAFASPVPSTLVVEGRIGEWRDGDWWALPVLERETEVRLGSTERRDLSLVAGLEGAPSIIAWDSASDGYRGVIPAGVATYLHVKPNGAPDYRIELHFADGPSPGGAPGDLPLELSLELDAGAVAAYHPAGQIVGGQLALRHRGPAPLTVALETATSDMRWQATLGRREVTVAPGGREVISVTLRVPVDAWADVPVRISVRAADGSGAQVAAHAEVAVGREAVPVNRVRAWPLPEVLRGGFNVAQAVLGGRRVPDAGEKNRGSIPGVGDGFDALFDGTVTKNQGLTLRGGHGGLEVVPVTVELPGDAPIEVAGFALSALGHHRARQYPRDVVLQLSTDGARFDTVATAVLDPVPQEQFVVLKEPRTARFARLLLDTNWEGRGEGLLGLGEWKVIARPGIDISGGQGFDLASPELGGHVVWAWPRIDGHWNHTILTAGPDFRRVGLDAGERLEWVVGFHHGRAAEITRVVWEDSPRARPDERFHSVAIAASTDSPVGPWEPLGELRLPAGGGSGDLLLERPVWARYVKFSAPAAETRGVRAAPERLRIWERPTGGGYLSILTEWGDGSQQAIYEALREVEAERHVPAAGNRSRSQAASLDVGTVVAGQVQLGKQEHWYRIAVPPGQNTLTFTIGGEPTVRVEPHLETGTGTPIPLRRVERRSTPRAHVLEAVVTPGSTVFVRIAEPPRNVLFLWDTSASVGAYLPVIYNSLLAYAEDLVPGRDAANFLPFGVARPLLRDWYGEPYVVQTVLNEYPRRESSSDAEKTLHAAARALAPRPGTKAIVVVTDAATTRYDEVWEALADVQPRIFVLGVGSAGVQASDVDQAQDLMQDWSRVSGGHYTHLLNEGEMEIAFDRAASLLRRPAPYTLSVTSERRAAPGPGRLTVISGAGGGAVAAGARGAAIELILDASGSMLQRMDGKRRIEVARQVLQQVVTAHIPAGTPVALRVFGHRQANACRTDLEVPLTPLDPPTVTRALEGITAKHLAKTPIADSLAKVEADLRGARGRKIVVLVTDGEETCEGDPEKVIRTLRDKGVDVSVNIVGFGIDDPELERQFERWAEVGGGRYFQARDQTALTDALADALRTPFAVYDHAGSLVREGVVDGEPVELAAGTYRVIVSASPAATFETVDVSGGQEVRLELPRGSR